MVQKYSLKAGFKSFGEKGEHEVSSELTHIHNMETLTPLESSKLSTSYRLEALA